MICVQSLESRAVVIMLSIYPLWVKSRQIVAGRIRPLSAVPPITKLDGHPRQHSTDHLRIHAIYPIDELRDGDEVRAALGVRHPYLSWVGPQIPSSPWRRQLGPNLQLLRGVGSGMTQRLLHPAAIGSENSFLLSRPCVQTQYRHPKAARTEAFPAPLHRKARFANRQLRPGYLLSLETWSRCQCRTRKL